MTRQPLAVQSVCVVKTGCDMQVPRSAATIACLILCLPLPGDPSSQLVEDLVNIRFQVDARLFAVMAAINVAGFDLDADALRPDSARRVVRERLVGINPELHSRLKEFCRSRDSERTAAQRQSKYISFALHLKSPPKLALACKPEELPADAQPLIGFDGLVAELWQAGGLERLWDEVRPQYLLEIETYRPLIRDMIVSTLRYMRTEARVALDRQVIFIPDLLNGIGIVNARNVDRNYIVVVGPSRSGEKLIRSVRHEYLHFLIDPLLSKYVAHLPEAEPFLKRILEQPAALPRYQQSFYLMVTESLLQMAELRLDGLPGERQTAVLLEAYDQGLILAPYFEEVLRQFEKGSEALAEVFQGLVEGIRWEVESGRDAVMARVRSEVATRRLQVKAAEEARAQSGAEIRSLLGKANQHLLAREFDKAQEILGKVLQLDVRNASALFGMAQVAAQGQLLDKALELYRQAAANAGEEVWIAAWSLVHRGNIYRVQGYPESAKGEWSKVLGLQGDLRGAAEAARRALAATQP